MYNLSSLSWKMILMMMVNRLSAFGVWGGLGLLVPNLVSYNFIYSLHNNHFLSVLRQVDVDYKNSYNEYLFKKKLRNPLNVSRLLKHIFFIITLLRSQHYLISSLDERVRI